MEKTIRALMAVLVILSSTGCLKDEGFDNQEYGTQVESVKVVSFPESQYSPLDTTVAPGTDPVEIGGPFITVEHPAPVTEDVTVEVEENAAALLPAGLTPLPAGSYTVSRLAAVIKAGERDSEDISVTLSNPSLLDPSLTYGIAFRIKSASQGYIVARNQRELVYSITIE